MPGVRFRGATPPVGKLFLGPDIVSRLYYGAEQVWPSGLEIVVEAGSYTLSGQDVVLRRTRNLVIDVGAYALSGRAAGSVRTWLADAGTYSLGGVDVTFRAGRRVAADAGAYALAGQAVDFRLPRLTADRGVYTLQGQTVNLLNAHVLSANAGVFVLSGVAAQLGKTLMMPAAGGSYALTGRDAGFLRGMEVGASVGSFVLTGRAVSLLATRKITADPGSYGLAGVAANLLRSRSIVGAAGSYGVTGNAATLDYDSGSSGYSFNMTAGDLFGAAAGYFPGFAIGSIDAEPVPGHALASVSYGFENVIQFSGNAVALLSGKTVWVNGVQYPFTSDWAYSVGDDWTAGSWTSGAPVFVVGNSYFVEIK